MKIILGIDPGSCITGYGLIYEENKKIYYLSSGCIKVQSYKLPNRLSLIYSNIVDIVLKFKPNCVAIEQVFIAKNISSALKLNQAYAVAIVASMNMNIPVFEYATKSIKQIVTGHGSAKKKQVKYIVSNILEISNSLKMDETDALAVAITHYHISKK